MACSSGGTVEIYVEPVLPPLRLAVFGSTPVSAALARLGEAMGYRVERGSDARIRGAHVLIATMGDDDAEALESALAGGPAYVGLVASRKRFESLRAELGARGVSREALERVVSPAGLDIGARTPEEIALSVLAQMVAERRKKAPSSLAPAPPPGEQAIDPICGMTVAVATARHKAELEGVAYYFCCAGCRTKFLQGGARP
jgi:xanthine dehydrogenase accessory factor